VLTTIYGEEDWNAMRQGDEEQNERRGGRARPHGGAGQMSEPALSHAWRRPPQIVTGPALADRVAARHLVYLVLAVGSVEVNWARVYDGLERGQRFIMGFLQPDFTSRWRDISQGLVESLTMTLTSTVVGVAISVPIGIGAARNLAPRWIYYICRSIIAVSRCAAGGDHRDLLRGDVRLRPLRGVPDAELRHHRLSSPSCWPTTSRRSTRRRPRPCAPPARRGGSWSTTPCSRRSCRA
jgi:hypothetical protein